MNASGSTTELATADVVVIGGGLHGCSAALHCAMRGLNVVVVEKNTVGRHASGVNAGGVRRLGRDPAEVPLSLASMEIWHRIEDLVDDDCGFEPAPQIKVAESDEDLAILRERADMMRGLGYEHEELIDQQQLREVLPALAPHCIAGLASFGDGFANPYQTTFAFQRKAESLGVRFFEETRALTLDRAGERWCLTTDRGTINADNLVNCAGAWAAVVCEQLGEPVPLEPIAPMMIVTARLPHFCDPVVGGTGRPLSFKQMPNGTVVIGGGRRGTPNLASERTELKFSELAKTAQTAAEIFPIVRGSTILRTWAGIEARMPDDIPVIGRSSTSPNVFHAFGFSAHGFQLGPVVGGIIADLICEQATNLPIDPFAIDRFAVSNANA